MRNENVHPYVRGSTEGASSCPFVVGILLSSLAFSAPYLGKIKNCIATFKKDRLFKQFIQRNIGINQNLHFRYLASLSSRICSAVMSPRCANIPVNESERGVWAFCSNSSNSFLEMRNSGDLAAVGFSSFFTKGITFNSTCAVAPAGTSRGTSMVNRWLAGISTVCVMVIHKNIA